MTAKTWAIPARYVVCYIGSRGGHHASKQKKMDWSFCSCPYGHPCACDEGAGTEGDDVAIRQRAHRRESQRDQTDAAQCECSALWKDLHLSRGRRCLCPTALPRRCGDPGERPPRCTLYRDR